LGNVILKIRETRRKGIRSIETNIGVISLDFRWLARFGEIFTAKPGCFEHSKPIEAAQKP